MSKALFVNPNYYSLVYSNAKIRAGITSGFVPIGLISLAACARQNGHQVAILDLNISENPEADLVEKLRSYKPDVVAITAVTPTIAMAGRIAATAKKEMPSVKIIVGGPQPTAMPAQTLETGCFDAVCVGEGEYVLCRYLDDADGEAPGLWRYDAGTITPPREPNPGIQHLDSLPFPAYDLLEVSRYNFSDINSRNNPTGTMETSRGCYANCVYCNKLIHGHKMRFKSIERVADEMQFLLDQGFREIGFYDDCFTADMPRAMGICEEIMKRGMKLTWTPVGGVRVDRVTPDLLRAMRRAGC